MLLGGIVVLRGGSRSRRLRPGAVDAPPFRSPASRATRLLGDEMARLRLPYSCFASAINRSLARGFPPLGGGGGETYRPLRATLASLDDLAQPAGKAGARLRGSGGIVAGRCAAARRARSP